MGQPVPIATAPLKAGEKMYCVSYAPFRGNQSPHADSQISEDQIREDLERLARTSTCVRTYSTELGLHRVPEIARKLGLNVLQGVWISRNRSKNTQEIDTAIGLAKAYPDVIKGLIVGNEVLLRGELTPAELGGLVRSVNDRVSVPVTYADVWEFWMKNPAMASSVDFITIHILPYWEDFPVSVKYAARHIDTIRTRVAKAFAGKEVLIGEAGWPSQGRMREAALPSPVNQARHVQELLALAAKGGYRLNLIEAFDQPWKRMQEGTAGGYWGILDGASRQPKFDWGAGVSNHPHWKAIAGGGMVFSALIYVAGWLGRRGVTSPVSSRSDLWRWVLTGGMALAGGLMIGWVWTVLPLQSVFLPDWLKNISLLLCALLAPLLGAFVVMGHGRIPTFLEVLAPVSGQQTLPKVEAAFGWVLILLCVISSVVALGLVFDPRYKDFPFQALTAAVTPYLMARLAVLSTRHTGPKAIAEQCFAALFAAASVYMLFNETLKNWQALWLAITLLSLSLVLWRARAVPETEPQGQ